jgi:DNA-binding response OmpR family regulator
MQMSDLKVFKRLTILYAEDNDVIRESVTKILEFFFESVLVAKDGLEAVELYKNNTVHVVLLDYVMPTLNGYEVALKIRDQDGVIPIIIASAYTDKEKLMSVIPLNLTEFIEKPVLYENLVQTFKRVLKQLEKSNLLQKHINDELSYNMINKSLTCNGVEINLTKKEHEFIELLLKNENQLVNKDLIKESLFEQNTDDNTLRNMIYRLRKKVDFKDSFVTLKDLVYILHVKH